MEVLVLSKTKKEYGPFSPIPGIVSVWFSKLLRGNKKTDSSKVIGLSKW